MINDTVFALSTAPGKSGIAVFRVSGPNSFSVLRMVVDTLPKHRVATLRNLRYKNDFLDQAIVICFEQGSSFTGEEMVELHVHGGHAVIQGILDFFSGKAKLRLAKPGEFTRRALENGKLDLLKVEGLSYLIDSETKMQKKQSLRLLSGSLSSEIEVWKTALIRALSLAEVMIDFSDEDVPSDTISEIRESTNSLVKTLSVTLQGYNSAEIIRNGFQVAIIGKPNVGKSSLLNYLCGKEKAIVSNIPGTTRDILELKLDINGVPVYFYDTAGIRETSDPVEVLGVDLAKKKAEQCALRVFLLNPEDKRSDFDIKGSSNDLLFLSKCDIRKKHSLKGVSGKTGEGVSEMLKKICQVYEKEAPLDGLIVNERHKQAIINTLACLTNVSKELNKTTVRIELVAEELRSSITEMDLLSGRINVERVLDNIFLNFCIGK
ncbi:MAG: tRNA uridine-5-carboxymethylaminomethyl(34) synthesis GTPase MnmE [Pseudomonadota bacterium]|nr:tRNA uridine-5-carboxymethylaminomethyl(34) synthesis GTPase MnmE [Pseudomonadota bacterium]